MTVIVFLTTLRVLLGAVLVLGELWEGSLRVPWRSWGGPWGVLGGLGRSMGGPWVSLGVLGEVLGVLGRSLGGPLEVLGGPWGILGGFRYRTF